jgi:hypothetical protein
MSLDVSLLPWSLSQVVQRASSQRFAGAFARYALKDYFCEMECRRRG